VAMNQFDVNIPATALTGSAAKTVVGVQAPANIAVKFLEAKISFDGAVSTNTPVTVEIAKSTFATNAPGTASTTATKHKRDPGRQETIQSLAATNWTTEPTVLTVEDTCYVGQYNGLYHYIAPFASPIIVPGGQGIVIRVTSPNNVNCSGKITCEE
jgi:hypothetical protein